MALRRIYRKKLQNQWKNEDWVKYIHKRVNPLDLNRGRGKYHIDHKFSILEGFKNNILPIVISHPFNLQMLKEKENISKDFRCSITKRDLYKGVA